MAAPSPTARVTPTGIKLKDGHSTKITFGSDPNLEIWEKMSKPPGVDGGDFIPQTTMHNTEFRTFAPRQLKTLTEAGGKCAYDPGCLTAIMVLINKEDTVIYTFPDGTTWAFFAALRVFEPDELEEGTQPEAQLTIEPTNWDPAGKVEAGPAVASVAGT